MKAVVMTAVGGAEVLQVKQIDEPQITEPHQVKIRIKAAGVNPVDTKIRRKGLFYGALPPAVLGCDGAGTVISTGADVIGFKPGDDVWYCHGGLGRESGNYCEYTVIDSRWLAAKPQSLTFIEAAAAPLVLITAWGALYDRGALQPGQTVLIHAGAGGVGHVAIQLAKLRGARVIATVSSQEKADFVAALGADVIINYHEIDFVEAIMQLTDNHGVDLVLDTVGTEVFQSSIYATACFGSLVTLLDPGLVDLAEARVRNLKIGFELMLTPLLRDLRPAREKHIAILNSCKNLIDNNRLMVSVGRIFPLEQVTDAHRLIEEGHCTGKIVLEI
ncbi:zinc-dependent alcohol dehydrogenase family protein [Methylicorpusculum oleiharenae]|uniref:zinc-dependent alcohol dehydrogenase family protein n=1 Tax=Methylicorpusculum oleiharenae TaxID=1338687 RepID=UPI00135B07BD|nr:zinc-dependent alcohol dehydrogenase family protein [Methylicorpusculum oleiharenae]MCD2452965.1 zinc-dependent alcohol dehydrogenase family protein [Methylicorpusculum oleiharenae]